MLIACRNGMHLDISGERLKPDGTGYLHHIQIVADNLRTIDAFVDFKTTDTEVEMVLTEMTVPEGESSKTTRFTFPKELFQNFKWWTPE